LLGFIVTESSQVRHRIFVDNFPGAEWHRFIVDNPEVAPNLRG